MRNAILTALALAPALTGCLSNARRAEPPQPTAPYLLVLGTAQDGGLPQIACRRECCEAARADPGRRRHVTSLLLVDPRSGRRWIFDASPDLPLQVELARGHGGPDLDVAGRPALFDGVFLTHAHMGHYSGLIQFGREAYGSAPVDLVGTPRMLQFLTSNGPWSLLFEGGHAQAVSLPAGSTMDLADDLHVTAIQVPHRDEFSDTVGFRIEGPEHSALYLPDIDKWTRWDRDLGVVVASVDYALLDGTFYGPDELPGRNMADVPHPFIVETMEALAREPAPPWHKVFFTHLNHSNPAADPNSAAAAAIEAAGAHVLDEGAILPL